MYKVMYVCMCMSMNAWDHILLVYACMHVRKSGFVSGCMYVVGINESLSDFKCTVCMYVCECIQCHL